MPPIVRFALSSLVISPGSVVEPASPKNAVSDVPGPVPLLQLAPVAQLFPAGPFHVTVTAPQRAAAVPSAASTTALPILRPPARQRRLVPISIFRMQNP